MPAIRTQGLTKTYRVADKKPGFVGTVKHFIKRRHREIQAVKAVDLTIEPGEVVGFLGPNGAGKTTTLKMLTGLVHPTAGAVSVLGHEPFKRKAELLKQITLVMGNKQQMIWDLPPMDSLHVNAAVYGIEEKEAMRRVEVFAELLGLDEELTQPVRKLSLGQRMKCELVAALLHHPKVLFLDEPTLGLDLNAQTAVRSFLKQYNEEQQASILLTSHYMADITALCPRVVVIHEGALLYDGSLEGVVQRFAPLREVKLDLAAPVEDAVLNRFGEIEANEGRVARLLVQREALTDAVGRVLAELDVEDLTVTDPPIEDVIARLFDSGNNKGETTP
ncbi:MAG: ATP-binding cassette domain-containing protein [Phycisphaeraceae bacterium]|nr:ATP-binding cassette domain-containing protein [Phycisphaeraceae bacterium]